MAPSALQYGPSEGYRPLRTYARRAPDRLRHAVHRRRHPDHQRLAAGAGPDRQDLARTRATRCSSKSRPTWARCRRSISTRRRTRWCRWTRTACASTTSSVLLTRRGHRAGASSSSTRCPNFQNPTGRTLSLERRQQLVELASHYGVPIVEDDPYGELRYEGERLPTLKSLDTAGSVIYLGTFSKILAPGFRLGWILASPEAMEVLLHGKQPSDLHTGMTQQMATYEVARRRLRRRPRRAHQGRSTASGATSCCARSRSTFPPDGALHASGRRAVRVGRAAAAHRHARTAGSRPFRRKSPSCLARDFTRTTAGTNTMRLNFSNVPPDQLREGVRRLGTPSRGGWRTRTRSRGVRLC